jgi:hypothetical protein
VLIAISHYLPVKAGPAVIVAKQLGRNAYKIAAECKSSLAAPSSAENAAAQ